MKTKSKDNFNSLNTSPAKQKYSFSKSKRFSPYVPTTDLSYLPNSNSDRRSAIMGYGQRSIVHDKTKVYYPHAYSIPSIFEGKKGYSFKADMYFEVRQQDIDGPRKHLKYSKSLPGPTYGLPSSFDSKGPTIKSRMVDKTIAYREYIPGPGTYDVPSNLNSGKNSVFESQFSNGGSIKFVNSKQKQVEIRSPNYKKYAIPGVGEYDLMKYSVGEGVKSKSKFSHEERGWVENKELIKIPGPGEYQIHSEFGN